MCQAFEGEQNYLLAADKATRKRGYKAFLDGVPISSCPESDHPLEQYSDKHQWELGWKTAESGQTLW